MGCDIHIYPEYQIHGGWSSLATNVNPGRDYELFTKLAGVRGDPKEALIPPRGVPADRSLMTKWGDELFINDETVNSEGCCSRASAERWVAQDISQWVDDRKASVTDPDHHTRSWLSTAEFRQALESPSAYGEPRVEYWGLLAMLEEVQRRGHETRIVFWFDN